MSPQTGKLVLAIVLLTGAAAVYFFFVRQPSLLPSSIRYVDISTGKIVQIAYERIPTILPGENPATGERTLLPVEDDNGVLRAARRHAYHLLRDPEVAKVNKYVDPNTFEVLKEPRQP
ncbi:MAG: hypothetical protein IPM18_13520 [Phycisphaerales bacterium]|nr:hypothetical protein [Phycisphaerales bacterium]